MVIKIAIASSDGRTVNQHFGHARQFRIYQLDAEGAAFIEVRTTVPACSGHQHSDYGLEQTAALIADCQAVVISQIGAGAIDLLLAQRTLPYALEGSIDDALATLRHSKLIRFVQKERQHA
jgi:predicted Fe-Mo cluster-binding NifX family protein